MILPSKLTSLETVTDAFCRSRAHVVKMSFENYGQFPNAGQQDGAPGQPPAQDGTAPGQPGEQGGNQSMQFAPSDNNSSGPGQGGEQKTTLWYEQLSFIHM